MSGIRKSLMRRLSLDHLQTFAHVVELGSFSAAAQRLKLSQPAISLQMRQLEGRLGVRLIDRVGRRASATAAGEELLTHARRIEGIVTATLEAMKRHSKGTAGRVRLGTGATACIYFLPPILRALRNRFPELDIVVSTGNTSAVLKSIEENTIDLGLVTLPAPGRMFDVRGILDDEFVAIGPTAAIELPGRVTPLELAKLPLVLYESGANTRLVLDQWALRAGVSLKPVMELASVEAIKEVVGAGLGCGVVPRMALRRSSSRPSAIVRSLSPKLHRKLAVVLRRDKPLGRALREVVGAIHAFARDFVEK
jgi:DNA-binding transcriptional LysR family regulator